MIISQNIHSNIDTKHLLKQFRSYYFKRINTKNPFVLHSLCKFRYCKRLKSYSNFSVLSDFYAINVQVIMYYSCNLMHCLNLSNVFYFLCRDVYLKSLNSFQESYWENLTCDLKCTTNYNFHLCISKCENIHLEITFGINFNFILTSPVLLTSSRSSLLLFVHIEISVSRNLLFSKNVTLSIEDSSQHFYSC